MFSLFGNPKADANKAMMKGDFAGAIKSFRKALEKDPNDFEAHHDLGVALLESGAVAESVPCFERANAIRESPVHWTSLGRAHQAAGNHAAAMSAYGKARSLDPASPMPWYNSAVCLMDQGKMDECVAEVRALLEKFPDHAGSRNVLGAWHLQRKEMDQALAQLQLALKSNPQHPDANINMIRLLCQQQRFPEAMPHLESLSRQGHKIEVAANDGRVRIAMNGQLLYEGAYQQD